MLAVTIWAFHCNSCTRSRFWRRKWKHFLIPILIPISIIWIKCVKMFILTIGGWQPRTTWLNLCFSAHPYNWRATICRSQIVEEVVAAQMLMDIFCLEIDNNHAWLDVALPLIPCLCNTRRAARAAASLARRLPEAMIDANSRVISSWTCARALLRASCDGGAGFGNRCTVKSAGFFPSEMALTPAKRETESLHFNGHTL
jgi:hypothetical protein